MDCRIAATLASLAVPKAPSSTAAREYKPIMLEAAKPAARPTEDAGCLDEDPGFGQAASAQQPASDSAGTSAPAHGPQDLDSLAREVGLDENAVRGFRCGIFSSAELTGCEQMRLLYGRHGPSSEPVKFATFSVDEEYKQNEMDRESGLAQEAKPVRTVAPGRHQLQSLLNGKCSFWGLWQQWDRGLF